MTSGTWKMTNQQTLRRKLLDLDNSNYKAYRDIQGSYEFPDFTLIIDHVQGDPFAAPTARVRTKASPSQ